MPVRDAGLLFFPQPVNVKTAITITTVAKIFHTILAFLITFFRLIINKWKVLVEQRKHFSNLKTDSPAKSQELSFRVFIYVFIFLLSSPLDPPPGGREFGTNAPVYGSPLALAKCGRGWQRSEDERMFRQKASIVENKVLFTEPSSLFPKKSIRDNPPHPRQPCSVHFPIIRVI